MNPRAVTCSPSTLNLDRRRVSRTLAERVLGLLACKSDGTGGSSSSGDSSNGEPGQCPAQVPEGPQGYPPSAIPNGVACSGAATCEIGVVACVGEDNGAVNVWTCNCESGAWACSLTGATGSSCGPYPDASVPDTGSKCVGRWQRSRTGPSVPTSRETAPSGYLCTDGRRMVPRTCPSLSRFSIPNVLPRRAIASRVTSA
jgi:hypothetical protein